MDTYEAFQQVEMRVGKILKVEDFPEARKPAYKLWIDFGEWGHKQSSAQITHHYTKAELLGRQVIGVTNFSPRRIAGFVSEVLVLGAPDANGQVILLAPDQATPLGARVF